MVAATGLAARDAQPTVARGEAELGQRGCVVGFPVSDDVAK